MTRNDILIAVLTLGILTACSASVAQLSDDALMEPEVAERVRDLREQVDHFEGRRVLQLDPDALPRMRSWLDEMEAASEDTADVYESAWDAHYQGDDDMAAIHAWVAWLRCIRRRTWRSSRNETP